MWGREEEPVRMKVECGEVSTTRRDEVRFCDARKDESTAMDLRLPSSSSNGGGLQYASLSPGVTKQAKARSAKTRTLTLTLTLALALALALAVERTYGWTQCTRQERLPVSQAQLSDHP